MNSIYRLKALEKAATAGPWETDLDRSQLSDEAIANLEFVCAARNAIGPLLKVAEAAKEVRAAWTNKHVINTPLDRCVVELIIAVNDLEAQ